MSAVRRRRSSGVGRVVGPIPLDQRERARDERDDEHDGHRRPTAGAGDDGTARACGPAPPARTARHPRGRCSRRRTRARARSTPRDGRRGPAIRARRRGAGPRYSSFGSCPSAAQSRAAWVRCRWSRRPSRSSSSHDRSRGHSRMSASWATWTVVPSTVTSRAWARRSSTTSVSAPSTASASSWRSTRRLVSSVPSPSSVSRRKMRRARTWSSASKPAVHGLGRLRDRAPHPSGGAVPLDGERATGPPAPGLEQRVGEQRQRAGLVADVAQDQLGQARLHVEPGQLGRTFDRGADLVRRHRAQQRRAGVEPRRELRERGAVTVEVGADRDDAS